MAGPQVANPREPLSAAQTDALRAAAALFSLEAGGPDSGAALGPPPPPPARARPARPAAFPGPARGRGGAPQWPARAPAAPSRRGRGRFGGSPAAAGGAFGGTGRGEGGSGGGGRGGGGRGGGGRFVSVQGWDLAGFAEAPGSARGRGGAQGRQRGGRGRAAE
jgi:hypothetical protein